MQHTPNDAKGLCSNSTVSTRGTFTTNGVGGWVAYGWVRTDKNGTQTVIAEPAMYIQPGDRSLHTVVGDDWTPRTSGSEQLVFFGPTAPVLPAQTWSCVG